MAKREKRTERTPEGKNREKAEERMTTLQKYVSDMMAVEEHIGSAVNLSQRNQRVSHGCCQEFRRHQTAVRLNERCAPVDLALKRGVVSISEGCSPKPRGALRNALTPQELSAILRQIAIYCGFPAAVDCHRVAKQVLAAEAKKT